MSHNKIKVGITHGDFNGISYEIIIKTLQDNRMFDICTPIVYGSARAADYYTNLLPEFRDFKFNIIKKAGEAHGKRANMILCGDGNDVKVEPGEATPLAGRYAIAALDAAVRDLNAGEIDVLVTCPINKKNTAGEDFGFIGHTEYLAAQLGGRPLMFMISDTLRVGLVTMHIPLADVPDNVTTERVLEHIRLMKRSLERDFGVYSPGIAVLGLNPHAGDEGLLGNQEQEVIIPAIQSAKSENITAMGPFAADGFFGSGAYGKFDAVLAMYHDQGLAPFKALSFSDGVNFTAGLPAVRTSPAHGVGYDIAGKGVVDPSPLRAAIYQAIDIFRNRRLFDTAAANPLLHLAKERHGGRDANVEDLVGVESARD